MPSLIEPARPAGWLAGSDIARPSKATVNAPLTGVARDIEQVHRGAADEAGNEGVVGVVIDLERGS